MSFIRRKLNKKGFTLVELLIVIAVLGIIAGIGVNSMTGVTNTFKIKADEKTAEILSRSVEILVLAGDLTPGTDDAAAATKKILDDIKAAECQTVSGGTFEVTTFNANATDNIVISFGSKDADGDVKDSKGTYTGTIATKKIE